MDQDSQKSQREAEDTSRIPPELVGEKLAPTPPLEPAPPPEGPVRSPTSGPTTAGVEFTAKFAEETHQYVREYIDLADKKAAFVFTAGAALLAFLYQKDVSQRWLKLPNAWNFGDLVAFLAMAGLAAAALVALAVVVPRLKGSQRGYVFWDSIAKFESSTEYSAAVVKLSADDLVLAKLDHCHELAKICREKYRVLNLAIRIGAVGLGSSVVYLLSS